MMRHAWFALALCATYEVAHAWVTVQCIAAGGVWENGIVLCECKKKP